MSEPDYDEEDDEEQEPEEADEEYERDQQHQDQDPGETAEEPVEQQNTDPAEPGRSFGQPGQPPGGSNQQGGLLDKLTAAGTSTTGSLIAGAVIGALLNEKIDDNKEEDTPPLSP